MNILIDQNRRALLADFGLLTFVLDPTNPTASVSTTNFGGTTRWMSPELLHPQLFGFEDNRPTEESDRYALGMVILEVLTGQRPFADDHVIDVQRKVMDGEHPERPNEACFTDDLWGTLEQCWSPQPERRPTVAVVLECLERVPLATTLIARSFSQGELQSLLQTVFGNEESTLLIQRLQGGDTQGLVDILDKVCSHALGFQGIYRITPHLLCPSSGVRSSQSPARCPQQV